MNAAAPIGPSDLFKLALREFRAAKYLRDITPFARVCHRIAGAPSPGTELLKIVAQNRAFGLSIEQDRRTIRDLVRLGMHDVAATARAELRENEESYQTTHAACIAYDPQRMVGGGW